MGGTPLGYWPLPQRWDQSRRLGTRLRLLPVAAVGWASPVQREAVLSRRAWGAAPGGRQWGRPVDGAPVGGAGPGPWPHHGDGPV